MTADWSYCQARYKKEKSHALFSLLTPGVMKAAFFVTPFPGSAGGSVQPFSGQTVASLSGELCRQPVAMLLPLPSSVH